MSECRKSYDWLLGHQEHLTAVDLAYLKAINPNGGGFTMAQAIRIAVIQAQVLQQAARKTGKVQSTTPAFSGGNFGHVALAGELFRIKIDYEDTGLRERVKQIKGCRWNPLDKSWDVPHSGLSGRDIQELINEGCLVPSEAVTVRIEELIKREMVQFQKSRARESKFKLRPGFGSPDYQPRPFQLAGVEAACLFGAPMFADDMGLGKSIQLLAWTWHQEGFPLLVVTKATLKFNFAEEAAKAYPWAKITICDSKTKLEKSDVIIINYDLLAQTTNKKKGTKGWVDSKKKRVNLSPIAQQIVDHGFHTIAMDEAHAIKSSPNRKSLRGTACLQLGELAKAHAVITGTPIQNCNFEIINYLKFLRRLDRLGGDWHFRTRYCNAHQVRIGGELVWDFTGSSNSTELSERLASHCMIRRLKSEVLDELPDKTRTHIKVDLTNQLEYDKAKKNVLKYYSEVKAAQEDFLHSIRHLSGVDREIAIANFRKRVEIRNQFTKALTEFAVLRQITSIGKIDALVDKVADTIAPPGRKAIVFAYYQATQRALVEVFKPYGVVSILGTDSLEARKNAVKAFQNNPAVKVVVVSIGAGAEGLNLTAAQDVFTIETCFVPAIQWQCEDRAHRIGQKNAVNCYYFWGRDTIDEKVKAMLDRKTKIFSDSIDGERGSIDYDDLIDVLEHLSRQQ